MGYISRKVLAMTEFNCDKCGKASSQKASQYKLTKRHFCSRKCYYAWQKENRTKDEHPRWEGGVDLSEARRRWYQKNKARVAAMAKERRLRELNAGQHTEAEWQAVLKQYNGLCAYRDDGHDCKGKITKEHIVPLIMGGSNTIDNIKPACSWYNSKKWKRVALEFERD